MTKKKDKILIKLIKKSELNTPSIDFTDSIIEQLQVNVEEILSKDVSFAHLLQKNNTTILSNDFTDNILSSIEKPKSKRIIQPIITKKLRIIFAVSFLLLIILSFFIGETTSSNSSFSFIDKISMLLSQNVTLEGLSIVFICVVSFSSLLLFDSFLKSKLSF